MSDNNQSESCIRSGILPCMGVLFVVLLSAGCTGAFSGIQNTVPATPVSAGTATNQTPDNSTSDGSGINSCSTSGSDMADPVSSAAAGIEVAKTGISVYRTGKEIFEAINTNYGKLGISFTFILKLHDNITLDTNPIRSIIVDLGGKPENSTFRIPTSSGHIIINHIGYEEKEDDDISFETLLELTGVALPDQDLLEKYGELRSLSIPFIESVYLYGFINTPNEESIISYVQFF